ncbi:hypothetical protein J2S21_003982 [Peribacillus cavernae]|nr:hypothetical protein [Peribacillus cavernae]
MSFEGVSRLDFEWDVTNDIEMGIFRIRKKLRTVVEKNLQPFWVNEEK